MTIVPLSITLLQSVIDFFIRTQLRYFEAGQEAYVKQFLSNVAYSSKTDLSSYLKVETKKALEALLTYRWDEKKIQVILARGTTIEGFLGKDDKIINAQETFNFFEPLATTYFMKSVGHVQKTI